jgi:hypothetical protein
MSRGLGKVERQILAHLALYRRVGPDMRIEWRTEGSFYRKHCVLPEYDQGEIDKFERGEIVEMRRLQRELGVPKGALSRAARGLHAKGMVTLYCCDFWPLADCGGSRKQTKFIELTRTGAGVVSANFVQRTKSSLTDCEAVA